MSRPSSSRAAELLAQRAHYVAPVNAANLISILRKSSKRDLTTRVKAIAELREALTAETDVSVISMFLEHFVPVYVKTALFDCDWRVRAGFHEALALVAVAVGREIAPWLKTLLPVWITGAFDPSREAAGAALKALEKTFPDKEKRRKAVFEFAPTEVAAFVNACVAASPKTLNAMAINEADSTEDEQERYRVVVSACLGLIETYVVSDFDWSQLKIWELAKTSPDAAVQAKALGVLRTALRQDAALGKAFSATPKKVRLEIASLVENDDVAVSGAALDLLRFPIWLDGVSVEGFLAPKLFSLIDKGRLSVALSQTISHLTLTEKAVQKLLPHLKRSDFNPLATSSVLDFYASLVDAESRAPVEALQLLVGGELLVRGDAVQLIAHRWSPTLLPILLASDADVSAVLALIKTLNNTEVTASVVDQLTSRGFSEDVCELASDSSLALPSQTVEKLVGVFRSAPSPIKGRLGLALLARGAVDRSEVFSVLSPEDLAAIAVAQGADALPPLIFDHVDISGCLDAVAAIPDLHKLLSAESFFARLSENWAVNASAKILAAVVRNEHELDVVKTVELWRRAVLNDDRQSERLLRVHVNLKTLMPETLRERLAEDPTLNETWLEAARDVGLNLERIRCTDETVSCFARLVASDAVLATKVFNHRFDVAARVMEARISGQDWFVREERLLELFKRLSSRQNIFEVLVAEYLAEGGRTKLLAIKELLRNPEDLTLKDSKSTSDFRLCLVGLLAFKFGCIVDTVVRADLRAACERLAERREELETLVVEELDACVNFREVHAANAGRATSTASVLTADAGVVVGAAVCEGRSTEEQVQLAISACTNDRLVLDADVARVLRAAVNSAAQVKEAVALWAETSETGFWREASLRRLLSTEEKATDAKWLETTVTQISDVYQYLALWHYMAWNLEMSEISPEVLDAGIHAAVAVVEELDSVAETVFRKFEGISDLPSLETLATRILGQLLFRAPAAIQRWHESETERSLKAALEALLRRGLSQALIARHLQESVWETSDGDLTLQYSRSARQLVGNFQKGDLKASLLVTFPEIWPLRAAVVELSAIPGASKTKQQFQTLAVRQGLQQSGISRVLASWGRSVGRVVEGVEDCYICYSVVHSEFPNSLPSKKCATCKNAYHKECIYRWFRTSGKTLCPICQSPF